MSGAQTVAAQRNQARSERMFGRLEAPGGSAVESAPHTGLDPFLSDQEVPDLSMPTPPDCPPRYVDPADLIHATGIAEEFHVSRQAVHIWSQRSDFPAPVTILGTFRIWLLPEVLAWREIHHRFCRCGPCTRVRYPRAGA